MEKIVYKKGLSELTDLCSGHGKNAEINSHLPARHGLVSPKIINTKIVFIIFSVTP